MELEKPLTELLEAGYEATFAISKGQKLVPDPNFKT
jgi:hypothetical protein